MDRAYKKKEVHELNLFLSEFELFFYFFNLAFKLLVGFYQIVYRLAGVKHSCMVLPPYLGTNGSQR
jgi:hypothetical protein